MQPNDNDIVFQNYGPDFLAIAKNIAGLFTDADTSSFLATLAYWWGIYSIFAFTISAIFIFGIVYYYIRFNQLSEIEMNQLLDAERLWLQMHGQDSGSSEWHKIKDHLGSSNPNDWKLAIIEADIMLEKVLNEAGYAGNTIGDKLKSASPTNFTTLQDAWDAHIVRNKIAHEGSDYVVTQRIANEAITKYQKVFNEFEAI